MFRVALILALFAVQTASAQKRITWQTLSDVKFEEKWSNEVEANFYYPTFGKSVKALEGKEVFLTGFMLPLDPDKNYFILSRHPYASCFFCGSGGPDSVVELKLKPGDNDFMMDELVTVSGKLKLNADDIYQCNFIFENAEVFFE